MSLKKISVDIASPTDASEFMNHLQEFCEVFNLQIIKLIPVGCAGAWPEITFRGEEEDIRRFANLFYEEDYDDEWIQDDAPIEFEVFCDERYTTKGQREFINDDGTFV